ncbi:MAG: chemotaxis response regulator protein-glutamate methylesterase [Bacteroidetes bacterium]|nr:chemotaxis response regulator protein-glutamate methylesterase [Bacteroidota bacterium]
MVLNRQISVVVVDDSAFMRKSISLMLESDPDIKVVATARDGNEGIEMIRKFRPTVVTMDIEMPGMDGLSALKIIMKEMPLPVLMFSSLTTEGADSTMEALNLGAVDFIPKDMSYVNVNIAGKRAELIEKIKNIGNSATLRLRFSRMGKTPAARPEPVPGAKPITTVRSVKTPSRRDFHAMILGISTGGPFALLNMLPSLPDNFPLGIAIVQHMPPRFTHSLAERINSLAKLTVKEAEEGDVLEQGIVLIAPGGKHMTFRRSGSDVVARISDQPTTTLYRPCADVMMTSAVETFNGPLLGVIMTGMGKDGLEGLRLAKKKGGYVVAQNEESCVVYGMPKAVVDDGIADAVVPLDEIASLLYQTSTGRSYESNRAVLH